VANALAWQAGWAPSSNMLLLPAVHPAIDHGAGAEIQRGGKEPMNAIGQALEYLTPSHTLHRGYVEVPSVARSYARGDGQWSEFIGWDHLQ
jgi:hypothetical protein